MLYGILILIKLAILSRFSRCNMEDGTRLDPPNEFPFPFTPYAIQKDFMRTLYRAIEDRKLAIIESPTGTGKSMSIICGAVQWLIDHEARLKTDLSNTIETLSNELSTTISSSNWLEVHASQTKSRQLKQISEDSLKRINAKEDKIAEIKAKAEKLKSVNAKKQKSSAKFLKREAGKENTEVTALSDEEDDDILLDNVISTVGCEDSDEDNAQQEEMECRSCKVYICSRTHSQLSQLVHEIHKSPYSKLQIRVTTLASRQNYCINENVIRLKNLSLINERCQDLQKSKGKKSKTTTAGETLKKKKISGSCPFYSSSNIEDVEVKTLTEILDVEEAVQAGKELHGCPYYSSRRAVRHAQVVLLPYNTLLHKATRDACNIDLTDCVVIIDEAHNLLDTISSIHSAAVRGLQLNAAAAQLAAYRDRYRAKFSAANLLHLNQLIFVVKKLIGRLGGGRNGVEHNQAVSQVFSLAEFIMDSEMDTVNLFKVLEFVRHSRLCQKMRGFSARKDSVVTGAVATRKEGSGLSGFLQTITNKGSVAEGAAPVEASSDPVEEEGNVVLPVVGFIEALTNHCGDSRVYLAKKGVRWTENTLKVTILNPADHFKEIVRQARSVVLAGGTMEPMAEFRDLLLASGGGSERILTLTLPHVIPACSILPLVLHRGPSGRQLDFSFASRSDPGLLDDLGRLLVNVSNIVPGGIVCFFPSYDYEAAVHRHLVSTGIWDKLSAKKTVLREPKTANRLEGILREYSAGVAKTGAILLSVVGGKLSEGLNFSDDLGRCVIVVGLPYPNCKSLELQEKMRYIDLKTGVGGGQRYYENLCMKAVNQSIGRSIRHVADYATVLLLDHRYSKPHCVSALPGWIRKSLRVEPAFGPVMSLLAKFFASKKKL